MQDKKKQICDHENCKKRISIVSMMMATCKCNKQFCKRHRLPETHECSHDYKNIDVKLESNKLRCVSARIDYL